MILLNLTKNFKNDCMMSILSMVLTTDTYNSSVSAATVYKN
jgi:hypothetical protein